MTLGNGGNTSQKEYAEKYAISFRRGGKDDNPFFKVVKYFPERVEMDDVKRVSGTFQGVLHNEPKTITKRDGGTAELPASFTIVLTDKGAEGEIVYYVSIDYNAGSQMRATLNSLLSANVGDEVELYTKITTSKTNGKKYKVINVSNPSEKKEISYKDKSTGEDKTATVNASYPWAISSENIPTIDVVKDGDEILKVKDEEANKFFVERIKEKFDKSGENTGGDELSVEDVPF